MTDEQKRALVTAMYPHSKSWKNKVKKMSDAQVFAIWAKQQQKENKERKLDNNDQDDIPF